MGSSLPVVSAKDCLRALERAGFYIVRQAGSHARLFHRTNVELRVTIPVHGRDLPPGTLRNILRQAQLSVEDFRSLLGS
jgi:predicted RNA binding protein YcfA (HicA-like mRNA interferase family)